MQKVARNEKLAVARNARSCQKVAEQLVESPSFDTLHVRILHFRVYCLKLGGWFPVAELGFSL